MTQAGLFVLAVLLTLNLGLVVPQAAAEPKKITKCTTITEPGSYLLDKSLTAVGTCIVVAADFVTLDLDGQTLTGDGTGAGVNDSGVHHEGTVVKNGTIRGFANGVDLFASSTGQVERVRAFLNSQHGIRVGSDFTISGNNANGNLTAGIVAGNGSTISGNNASSNRDGIGAGNDSTISGNTASGNVFDGIVAGNNSTISGNTASNNNDDGIAAGNNSTISGNTASDNTGIGIRVSACAVNSASNIYGNTAQNNTGGDTSSLTDCVTSHNSF